jgi:hypothetical protein
MAVHWLIDSAGLFNAVSCYERASQLNRAVEWNGVVGGGGEKWLGLGSCKHGVIASAASFYGPAVANHCI